MQVCPRMQVCHERSLQHHTDEVTCCTFSASLLATGSGDKSLRLYDTSDFSELPCSPLRAHGYGVRSCCFTPAGDYLLSCCVDGSILVWSCRSGEVDSELQHPNRSPLRVCALAPDSSLLIAGASDGTVALWDFTSRTFLRCNEVSEASVLACCFSPCSHMVATGCSTGDLRIWDIDNNLLHAEKNAHDLGVTCTTFAPHSEIEDSHGQVRLASGGQDSQVKIWVVSQHEGHACVVKLLHTLSSQCAPVLCCAFSSDGKLVVAGSVDKSVAIYETEQGILLHTLKQHNGYVTTVAVSPSMPWLATGSMDRSVHVWKIGDGPHTAGKHYTHLHYGLVQCQGKPQATFSRPPLPEWSEEDVQAWLREESLEDLLQVFQANKTGGAQLSRLSKETMMEMGIESARLRARLLGRVEALKVEQSAPDCPEEFVCPISRELMKDPVIAADGFSYERESMESWLRGKKRSSPMTNLLLKTTLLTPNRALKMAISRWKRAQL
ncbi:WD repeat, SAM and U-box domain-containing protein 1-like [Entelurus aequoreus]|uniref:WD repeat, SAM and U-box domain-containing protein 1-like n=1 Tax=Entelurus aequoreus TaxID=161455 RepID=UPI002B1D5FAE|nr:WD repeat, SAM and U-box domain-containing protein 1-like [Entelurus aequoreus]